MMINTDRLQLVACDAAILEQAINDERHLAVLLGVNISPDWTEFGLKPLRYALNQVLSGAEESGWWTYFPVLKANNTLIGTGGYKGRPSAEGEVEIGYEIAPLYRGRGLGAEMAGGLIAHAFKNPDVRSISAHTLAGENASVNVLRKCGFVRAKAFMDPESGLIWKWLLNSNH